MLIPVLCLVAVVFCTFFIFDDIEVTYYVQENDYQLYTEAYEILKMDNLEFKEKLELLNDLLEDKNETN